MLQKLLNSLQKILLDYEIVNKSENQHKLQALVNRKNDLVKFLAAEKTRLKHPSHVLYVPEYKKIYCTLRK